MYRKSAHYLVGGYDENILHGCDWDFALKMVNKNLLFKKIKKPLGYYPKALEKSPLKNGQFGFFPIGLYYENPNGLSTTQDEKIVLERRKSEAKIFERYKHIYPENYIKFKPYFDYWANK